MKNEVTKKFQESLENHLKQKGIDPADKVEGKGYCVYFCPTCQEEGHGKDSKHLYFNFKKRYLKCLYEKDGVKSGHGADIYDEVKKLMQENE